MGRTIEEQWKELGFEFVVQIRTSREWLDYAIFKLEADAKRFIERTQDDLTTFRIIKKADATCNGYANYPTWAVNLTINQTEENYNYYRKFAEISEDPHVL